MMNGFIPQARNGVIGSALLGFGAAALAARLAPGAVGKFTGAIAGGAIGGLPGAAAGYFHDMSSGTSGTAGGSVIS